MSVGQGVGGLVGGVIGAYMGNPVMGAQAGIMLGGALDPPSAPKLQRPSLSDRQFQSSTYGQKLPRVYSTVSTKCNVIWLQNNKYDVIAKDAGGKGAPASTSGGSTIIYEYYATFAIAVCKGPVDQIGRIWCSGKLIYDPFATTLNKIRKSKKQAKKMTFYYGDETQEPDPHIQADRGVDNTSAYRGVCYIVIRKFFLQPYGNTLAGAEFEVEVIKSGSHDPITKIKQVWGEYNYLTGTDYTPEPYYLSTKKCLWSVPIGYVGVTDPEDIVSAYTYKTTTNNHNLSGTVSIPEFTGNYAALSIDNQLFSRFSNGFGGSSKSYYKNQDGVNVGYNSATDTIWVADDAYNYENAELVTEIEYYEVVVSGVIGVTQDKLNEKIYVVCDDRIEVYDFKLTLLRTVNVTFSTGTIIPVAACAYDEDEDGGFVYILVYPVPAGGYLYKFDVELDVLTYIGQLPAEPGNGWSDVKGFMAVDAGVIALPVSRQISGQDYVGVVWYYDGVVVSGSQTLGDIVEEECLQSNLLSALDLDVTDLTQEVRGYKVSEITSIRASIETLQMAFPFDVIQSGYKIKFVSRGQSSVATFTSGDLAPDTQLKQSREMDTQIPRKVIIKHIDAENREYDAGEQYAQRLNTDAVNVDEKQLPIVLTPDEAAQLAEMHLYLYWLERQEFDFYLPPSARDLEPSDVITLTMDYAEYNLRLTKVDYQDDSRLHCTAKLNNAAVYTSTAVGGGGESTGGDVAGDDADTNFELLDLPCLNEDYLYKGGLYIAMYGDDEDWSGGVVIRSTNNGASFTQLASTRNATTVGVCVNALADAGQLYQIDCAAELNVNLLSGTLSSVTLNEMLSGQNHFAYGADGRWEIIAAQIVTDEDDDSVTLSNIIRGRFGTTHATASHEIGDKIILIDDPDLLLISANSNTVGAEYIYRGISNGEDIDTDADKKFTFRGVNLKPYPPVNVITYKNPSADWEIYWTRQDRNGDGIRNYVGTPMSEESESYRIRIYTDNTYSVVKREIAATTENCTYTYAQQLADFGAGQTQIYIAVYQISALVGYGYPSRLVSTSADNFDPYYSYVALNCDFTANLTDYSTYAHTVTASGAAISGGYLTFDGSNDYCSVPDHSSLEIGANDFTIEMTINFDSLPSLNTNRNFVAKGRSGASTLSYQLFQRNSSNNHDITHTNSGNGTTNNAYSSSAQSLVTGSDYHVALTRVAGQCFLSLNGSIIYTFADSTTFYNSGANLFIGATDSPANFFHGKMKWLRITNGIGRYVSDFTPPSAAFPHS